MQISVPNGVPALDLTVPLDGTAYIIRLRWNMRSGWYIGLSALDGSIISSPRRLVNNYPLFAHLTSALRPPGVMWVYAPSEEFAGLEAFGRTHFLMYEETT